MDKKAVKYLLGWSEVTFIFCMYLRASLIGCPWAGLGCNNLCQFTCSGSGWEISSSFWTVCNLPRSGNIPFYIFGSNNKVASKKTANSPNTHTLLLVSRCNRIADITSYITWSVSIEIFPCKLSWIEVNGKLPGIRNNALDVMFLIF